MKCKVIATGFVRGCSVIMAVLNISGCAPGWFLSAFVKLNFVPFLPTNNFPLSFQPESEVMRTNYSA